MTFQLKAMRRPIAAIVALALAVLMLPWSAVAQAPAESESDYVVQTGDWLAKIAEQHYGDYSLYPAIVLATNARSATDSSYAAIGDPWLIEPGWKLRIPDAQTAGTGFTVGKLKNAEYQSEWTQSGKAPLADGEYSESAAPGSATKTVVKLTDRMAFGSLGSAQEAAAVILVTDPGGSGTFYYLSVVVIQDDALVNVATTLLGDRVKINSLSIEDGHVALNMITHGPDDPLCCPTQRVAQTYALQGDQLEQTSSEILGAVQPGGGEKSAGTALSLEGTYWGLRTYLGSQGDLVSVLPDSEITAEFKAGQITGNAGCNNYFGPYESSGDRLTVGLLGATLMSCAPEALMTQEGAYMGALQGAASYQITNGVLQIVNAEGETLLTFSVIAPASLTGTTWLLTGYNNGQGGFTSILLDTEITAIFSADGTMTGSAGCNNYTASYTAENGGITVGPAATTRKMCGEPDGIMEQESAYLAALASAATYQVRGETLELMDADGARMATFVVANPFAAVVGAVWKWQGTQTPTEQVLVDDPDQYTIEFLPDGTLKIKADCNMAGGTYATSDSRVEITLGPTTLAACAPDSLSDRFLKELSGAAIFFFDGDDLMIDLVYDSGTMRFARAE